MFEVKVTIAAPDLAAAINSLASAAGGTKFNTPEDIIQSSAAALIPPVTPAASAVSVSPVTPPIPAPPTAAAVSPVPNVPVAPPPQYTVDQIMAAGAALVDAGKANELLNLLHSFGVQAVTNLKPEQLGAFVTAMRGLGANI